MRRFVVDHMATIRSIALVLGIAVAWGCGAEVIQAASPAAPAQKKGTHTTEPAVEATNWDDALSRIVDRPWDASGFYANWLAYVLLDQEQWASASPYLLKAAIQTGSLKLYVQAIRSAFLVSSPALQEYVLQGAGALHVSPPQGTWNEQERGVYWIYTQLLASAGFPGQAQAWLDRFLNQSEVTPDELGPIWCLQARVAKTLQNWSMALSAWGRCAAMVPGSKLSAGEKIELGWNLALVAAQQGDKAAFVRGLSEMPLRSWQKAYLQALWLILQAQKTDQALALLDALEPSQLGQEIATNGDPQISFSRTAALREIAMARRWRLQIQLLIHTRQYALAWTRLDKAIEQWPQNPDWFFQKGLVTASLGLVSYAQEAFAQVQRLSPRYPGLANAWGYALADAQVNLPQANRYLKQALEESPFAPQVQDSWGWYLFRQRQWGQALRVLVQAYADLPISDIGLHLAQVRWAMGDVAGAWLLWERSHQQEPQHPDLPRLKAIFSQDPSSAPSAFGAVVNNKKTHSSW